MSLSFSDLYTPLIILGLIIIVASVPVIVLASTGHLRIKSNTIHTWLGENPIYANSSSSGNSTGWGYAFAGAAAFIGLAMVGMGTYGHLKSTTNSSNSSNDYFSSPEEEGQDNLKMSRPSRPDPIYGQLLPDKSQTYDKLPSSAFKWPHLDDASKIAERIQNSQNRASKEYGSISLPSSATNYTTASIGRNQYDRVPPEVQNQYGSVPTGIDQNEYGVLPV